MSAASEVANNSAASDDGPPKHQECKTADETLGNIENDGILSYDDFTNSDMDAVTTHVESTLTANCVGGGGSQSDRPLKHHDVNQESNTPTIDHLHSYTQNDANQKGGEIATITDASSEVSTGKESAAEIGTEKDGEIETIKMPESGHISGEGEPVNNIARKSAAVDSTRKIDSCRSSTRSRTRSLSSTAFSSVSGEHSSVHSGGGSAGDGGIFVDGKTPRRTNSFSSRGPMRKRHKQSSASRSLFRTDESSVGPSQEINADSKEDGLPRTFSSTSVTFANTRERSNTIESFRAAMDYQADDNDFATESIVLPQMKDSDLHDGETGSNFYDNHQPLPSPRSRSDTIDFLTVAEFHMDDADSAIYADEVHSTPEGAINDITGDKQAIIVTKKVGINLNGHDREEIAESTRGGAFGETPKIVNRSREMCQPSESPSQGPLRKRYRTRSLSVALSLQGESSYRTPGNLDKNDQREVSAKDVPTANEESEDDDVTEPGGCTGRTRSNTLDSFNYEIFGGRRRHRSDTMDFLTAAIAGGIGHDLDAAVAAAADDGASFAMHPISAPSGASLRYNPRPSKRPRSDTLDSTASSINSAKLDFFVSVAAEQGVLTSPIYSGGGLGHKRTGSVSSENSSYRSQSRPRSNTLEIYSNMASARPRSDTVDFLIGANDDPMENIDEGIYDNATDGNVLDHLNSLCDAPKVGDSKATKHVRLKDPSSSDVADGLVYLTAKEEENSTARKPRKNSEATWKTNLSQDSYLKNLTRNRLESWGGMSDLSAGGIGALAATHSALKDTGIMDDVLAAAADLGFDDVSDGASSLERMRNIRTASGGLNSLSDHAKPQKERARLNSLTSLSLPSLSDTSVSIAGLKDKSSTTDSKLPAKKRSNDVKGQPTKTSDTASVSTSIFVDYDAIASAVHAANAATEGLDLASILGTPSPSMSSKAIVDSTTQNNKSAVKTGHPSLCQKPSQIAATPVQKVTVAQSATKPPSSAENAPHPQNRSQPKPLLVTSTPTMLATPHLVKATPDTMISGPAPFPVTTINIPFVPIPESTKTKEEMDAIRERARAAAGYIPPGEEGITSGKKPPPRPMRTPSSSFHFNPNLHPSFHAGMPGLTTHIPIKKRGLPPHTPSTLRPDLIQSNVAHTPYAYAKPTQTPSSALSAKSGTLQSQQKWDDMFDCLVKFIEETREKSTKHMNEKQKAAWIWDGNVPTSYKTRCGKALGRWINNQRSAKAKEALKDDREVRLLSTGLKWSVLTTNSWRQMLQELEIYVREQTKDGRPWVSKAFETTLMIF